MADTTALKNRIRAAIKANDNQEITGPVLQQSLLDIVDELDLNPELQEAINTEKNARQSADTQLGDLITRIKNNVDNGYVYAGIATPSTNPVSGKVFYVAVQVGTYTNFEGAAVTEGITILKYNGTSWVKEQVLFTDCGVFDISAYHATGGTLATYTDLSAALDSNNGGGVPQSLQKGGMNIKFIQSSDNKYVQYFLAKKEWSASEADWQKMNLEEEVSQLGQKVGDIVTSIESEDYIPKINGWLGTVNTISQYEDAKFVILPVFRAVSMHIKTRGDYNTSLFIAKDYHDVVPATIELATGETGRRSIGANEDVYISLPSDAKYVYLQYIHFNGFKVAPVYVSIDGVLFISPIKQDITRVIDNTIVPGSQNYILSGGVSKSVSDYSGQFLELGDINNTPILYDNNGRWKINNNNYQGKYFAFSAGKKLKIVPNGNDALFSFLVSLNTTAPDYVPGTSRNRITEESIITAPEGTEYVWIMTRYEADRTPKVTILGHLSSELDLNKTAINNLLSVTSGYDAFQEFLGWLDGNSAKIVNYNSAKFIVIPIKDRKKIHITVRENVSSHMFIAKNYGTNLPVLLNLATGETGRRSFSGPYLDTTIDIPSDAEYLYVQSVNFLGTNLLPSYLSIDGIQIIPKKEDNSTDFDKDKQILRSALKSPIALSESANIFTFVHTSDTHLRDGNSRCFENILSLLGEDYINCLIHTGDIVWDNFPYNNDYSEEGYNIFNSLLQNVAKDVVFTVGNHDVGGEYKDINKCGTDKQVYDTFYAPFIRQNYVGGGTDKPYYYVDYPQKIRFISLYQYNTDFEIDPNDPTKLKDIRGRAAYRQDEIDWLCETLNNTPEGYAVFILTHQPESLGEKFNSWQSRHLANAHYSSFLSDIAKAYSNRSPVNVSIVQDISVIGTITAEYDFANAKGIFAGFLNGHTHDDFVGKDYYNNLNVINKCCDNMMYQSSSSIARIINSYSENTINVVSVNTNNRTITVFRVGAKYSADGDFRNVITLDY